MRLLFAKHSLVWPRSSGHDVHTYYMMKACAALGHSVALATVTEPSEHAIDGLPLKERFKLESPGSLNGFSLHSSWLQTRFRSFWGVEERQIAGLARATDVFRPDAVIVVGLDALPYFPALSGVTRIWYAADEWVLHHLTQIQPKLASVREHVRAAAIKGLYERAHRRVIDRVWVVSDADRRAMRWAAGMSHIDVLPNGVDGEFFRPGNEVPEPRTAVFWGRLDFGPNIQALEWFCRKVWPAVRREVPDAKFTIIGFQPGDAVKALAQEGQGITIEADLRDLRSAARRRSLAVLPFVSGAGIKNKLLEAAALGLPIVCTPMATRGLRGEPPLSVASTPEALTAAMATLWEDETLRGQIGADCRAWVLEHHSWTATAREAMAALESSKREAGR
jgi:glycosyltransferase involved in cell wall biosynthesis